MPSVFLFLSKKCPIAMQKNCVELIELGEVFALENSPRSLRQPTNFRDGEFFRAGKNLGE